MMNEAGGGAKRLGGGGLRECSVGENNGKNSREP